MFNPKFEYTDSMVIYLGDIERYRVLIDTSIIPPLIETQLKEQAKIKKTHFSTSIEGNPLNLEQVSEIIKRKGSLVKHKSELEVRNYWDALEFLERQKVKNKPIDEKFIKALHSIIENNNPGRRPKESKYREPTPPGVLFAVYDSITKEPDYIPPEADDVPILMKQLVEWILKMEKLPIPIKAAILSYQFLTIHPFVDGNGRTARALATYLLSTNGYDMKGLYSMEEFYAADIDGYYKNIQMGLPVLYYDGRNEPVNLAPWIEYFVKILVLAFEKVVLIIRDSKADLVEPIGIEDLNKKDRLLLTYLLDRPNQNIKPKEIAEIYQVTPRAISKWAIDWIEKGLIEPASGDRRITSYSLGEKYKTSK